MNSCKGRAELRWVGSKAGDEEQEMEGLRPTPLASSLLQSVYGPDVTFS